MFCRSFSGNCCLVEDELIDESSDDVDDDDDDDEEVDDEKFSFVFGKALNEEEKRLVYIFLLFFKWSRIIIYLF